MKKLRVLHINLYDYPGGAAKVAWTLMESMTMLGHDVHIFAHSKTVNDPRVIDIPFPATQWQRQLLNQQARQGLFDLYSAALLRILEHPLFEQADIIHLHCINGGYFSYLLLPFLTVKPTVWTLHDPLAFTAGCLNTDYCTKWRNDLCAGCPQDTENTGKAPRRELVQTIKDSIYKIANFTVVCPSQWLEKQAKDSILKQHDIRLIYNGIDIDTFQPGNRVQLRREMGLPVEKKLVMFAAHGGLNNPFKGGQLLLDALKKLSANDPDLVLLNIGTIDNGILKYLQIPHINIPFVYEPGVLAKYYAAADVFICSSVIENLCLSICEAMACGTPVVAFDTGGNPEIIDHLRTGYLAQTGNSDSLAHGISLLVDNHDLRQQMGYAARLHIVDKFSAKRMVDEYYVLYDELMQHSPVFLSRAAQNKIPWLVENAKTGGWENVWQTFKQIYGNYDKQDSVGRAVFTDSFFGHCITLLDPVVQTELFWQALEQWHQYRGLQIGYNTIPEDQQQALLQFGLNLRPKLQEYLSKTTAAELAQLSDLRQRIMLHIWTQLFLNVFSPLNQQSAVNQSPVSLDELAGAMKTPDWFNQLLVASMYYPFDSDQVALFGREAWANPLPFWCKLIFAFWLINVPYFNLEERYRQKVLQAVPELCQISMPISNFYAFTNEMVNSFWRISYVGGNNVGALSALGDFITAHMERFYPQYANLKSARRQRKKNDKIRIGYISRFFRNQAVSYYMVNRVIHHDKNKFEVFVFSLGDHYDDITELFAKHSEYYMRFTDLTDIQGMIRSIVASDLDILIYTDIGMDPLTYTLAGLQLAPVQCAMVGHGLTTGLPKIQYYLSGDFEPDDAHLHYRETLIRLPNLGAAQYFPPFTDEPLPPRKAWKIPDDVVVFVSCANGIKHGPNRDAVLLEILKQAPNACIVLKPYYFSFEDKRFTERVMAKAQAAGVANRLFIIPPLRHVNALLAIADIQLDTYPYGGWTTNMEALYMGLPIITQEGDMARNRWGAHLLRALGISEGIAANDQEYVEWAVKFAQDAQLRQRIKAQIAQKARAVLFNGRDAQAAYEKALLQIVNS